MEPRTRELITERVDTFIRSGRADLVTESMFEVPALIIFEMMCVPRADLMRVRRFAKRLAVFEFGHRPDEEQIGRNHRHAWRVLELLPTERGSVG
jgi:cytochrome P450